MGRADMGPYDTLSDLTDNEVIERARATRGALDIAPRGTRRDQLLRTMGVLYAEMNRRGMGDVVVEGGRSTVADLFRERK